MAKARAIIAFSLVIVCLTASSVVYLKPAIAQYQGEIIIDSDGSVTPSLAPIKKMGNNYNLTSNINGSITVKKSDVTLQGNKHTITVSPIFSSGITLNDVKNCTVANFAVSGGQYGINIYGAFNLVANNTISSVNNGIYSLNEPTGGIALSGTSNSIYGNRLQGNLVGINFFGGSPLNCSYNLIVGNTFSDCSTAMLLHDSSNNTFYHNNFISNQHDVYDSGLGVYPQIISVNTWDNGYPSGGNYWSDYLTKYPNAKMIDNSGIGDTAYSIEAQNEDRYPIINLNQFYNFQLSPPKLLFISPTNQSYNVSSVPLNFTIDKTFDWVGYSLDGRKNETVVGNSTLTNLINGNHNLTVYANDTFGNMGASQTIAFTVEKPLIEIIGSTNIITILAIPVALVCIGIGLLLYRRHRKTPLPV